MAGIKKVVGHFLSTLKRGKDDLRNALSNKKKVKKKEDPVDYDAAKKNLKASMRKRGKQGQVATIKSDVKKPFVMSKGRKVLDGITDNLRPGGKGYVKPVPHKTSMKKKTITAKALADHKRRVKNANGK